MHSLAVLVVACPCALGLAAPLATALAIDRLAQHGIVVRCGDTLYRLANVTRLALDKTGTLTAGRVSVSSVILDEATRDEVLCRAASLEIGSKHPLAQAIVDAASEHGVVLRAVSSSRSQAGSGISGIVDGQLSAVGSAQWFEQMDWCVPACLALAREQADTSGRTAVYVGWEGRVHAVIVLDDDLQTDAPVAVRQLHALGLETCIVSGDQLGPVLRVAKECAVKDWQAGLLPQDKADFVATWGSGRGLTAMVGDGINDGLAMQLADIGIAVGDGVDLARETADVVLPGSGLARLPGVIALVRRTRRLVLLNLTWALAYNALAIALAAAGLLQPIIAAALMAGSSIVVIANSMRLSQPTDSRCNNAIELLGESVSGPA